MAKVVGSISTVFVHRIFFIFLLLFNQLLDNSLLWWYYPNLTIKKIMQHIK